MVKKTYKYESEVINDFIQNLFSKMKVKAPDFVIKENGKKVGEGTWKSDNELVFKKNGKKFGSLTFPKNVEKEGNLVVEGASLIKIMDDFEVLKKKAEKNKVTSDKVKGTLFAQFFNNSAMFGGIDKNYSLFSKVNTELKKLGIKEVVCSTPNLGESTTYVAPKLILHSQVSGGKSIDGSFTNKFRNIVWAKYEKDLKATTKDSIQLPTSNRTLINNVGKEVVKVGKLDGLPVIHYYTDRNLIVSEINPFILFEKYDVMTKLPQCFTDFFEILKDFKIKKEDESKIKKQIFIYNFMKNVKSKIKDNKTRYKNCEDNIVSYERSLGTEFQRMSELATEIEYLEKSLDSNGETLFGEIDKAKKLPFVKEVKQKTDSIEITFVPTTLVVNDLKIEGKSFGKRTFYLGSYTFNIRPGSIHISSDTKITARHPHSSGESCCFGDGDGRQKLFSLLSSNQISEVSKMLWFWIKTYISSSAYVHHRDFYDSCLAKGLPIWDEKNKLILINDASRLKSGEQRTLSKGEQYAKNFKALGSMKVF